MCFMFLLFCPLLINRWINQSNYFIVRLKVGQLSLPHLGITTTEKIELKHKTDEQISPVNGLEPRDQSDRQKQVEDKIFWKGRFELIVKKWKQNCRFFSGMLLTHFKLDERAFLSNALTHTVSAVLTLVSVNVWNTLLHTKGYTAFHWFLVI